ncbi:uncharacterized protein LOC113325056 [Papaver somniferum]|uniref:uncharacterized protein LOC113325056 n=1 Tax=Papaver somniferum TaxID=3469 RepID=UPI000E6FD7CD|nr:uncharacterized protein LOC113325056 [Papaver somniferum]
MIPLGKGFFIFKLDNKEDKNMIQAGRWEVYNQVLWYRNWIPNFRPENHRTSLALIWVHLPGLSLEYWDEKTLFTICRASGDPVKVGEATLKFESGYYARILVNIDFAKKIPSKLWIKTKYRGFMQNVILTKPPKFCDKWKIIGHVLTECRFQEASNEIKTSQAVTPINTIHKSNSIRDPFDVFQTPINTIHTSTSFIQQEATDEENDKNMHEETVVSEKILQVVEDNTLEHNVVKYVNGKDGSISEEQIPSTSWSRVIQKPAAKQVPPSRDQQNHVINKVTSQPVPGKYNFRKNNAKGVFIAEPKVVCSASFCSKLNFPRMENKVIHNSFSNKKGNIWLFWNTTLPEPRVVSLSSQMITVEIGGALVSGIHAHVGVIQRRFLWAEMESISEMNKPWLAIGDFNSIVSQDEKIGGKAENRRAMQEFNNCLNNCDLIQAPKSGLLHSWSNCQHGDRRILCNLDRAVYNHKWFQMHENWSHKVGLRIASDHSTLLGGGAIIPKPSNAPFKFQKMWLTHPVFGNIHVKIKEAEEEVQKAMVISDQNPHDIEALDNLVAAENDYNKTLMQQFKQKFQVQESEDTESLLEVIPKVITDEDQQMLDALPEA